MKTEMQAALEVFSVGKRLRSLTAIRLGIQEFQLRSKDGCSVSKSGFLTGALVRVRPGHQPASR
jgi:hypothetical protein